MNDYFIVNDHVFDGQYIREYPGALAFSQEDTLKLHAKEYVPKEVVEDHQSSHLTIIGFHANAIPKETYEILWEEFCKYARRKYGIQVGAIWIADQALQGQSSTLNDNTMGNDPHWFDHSRDVLAMVNTFRKRMKRPIVGVGHSMGADQAVALAHYHPRLFTSLILIDPSLTWSWAEKLDQMLRYALAKPNKVDNLASAEAAALKDPFFKHWDRRVLKRYLQTAWKPTKESINDADHLESLTPEHMEVIHLVRPNSDNLRPTQLSPQQQYEYPDIEADTELNYPAYNPSTRMAYRFLPSLRPSTLYLLGKGSRVVPTNTLDERTRRTGCSVGGSGGMQRGKVAQVHVEGGHFLPMTNPAETAAAAVYWLVPQLEEWRAVERDWTKQWDRKSLREKQTLSPTIVNQYQSWDGKPQPGKSKI